MTIFWIWVFGFTISCFISWIDIKRNPRAYRALLEEYGFRWMVIFVVAGRFLWVLFLPFQIVSSLLDQEEKEG
jgi:hypothetical protein